MIKMGWLSPEGELIEAGYMDHILIADQIIEKRYATQYIENGAPDDWLIDHGWVHISQLRMSGSKYIFTWAFVNPLTQAQKDWLKPRVEKNWDLIEKWSKEDLRRGLELER